MGMLIVSFPLIIAFFPPLIAYFVIAKVRVDSHTFEVRASSIRKEYKFISRKELEFSVNKITGVVFRQSWIDKWFGTC
jgi:hypothetical protein